MIAGKFTNGLIFVGLSTDDVRTLMEGGPVVVDGRKLGIPFDVFVAHEATDQELMDALAKHADPGTVVSPGDVGGSA